MAIVGILLYVILFLKEFGFLKELYYKLFDRVKSTSIEMVSKVGLDSDVMEERIKVRNMAPDEIKETNLVMKDMTKLYGGFSAVKGVSVAVKE